jgi:putative Mg2+ transporter-C (MgtC) family protein
VDWETEIVMVTRSLIAAFLGALIGWQRESRGSRAGIRTFAAVSLGACTFGLVSAHVSDRADPTRIAAQVVSGIGFLGAGVILRDQGRVVGLTTAATLWSAAAVGLAIAYGMYILGTLNALIIFLFLAAGPVLKRPTGRPDDNTTGAAE